MRGNFTFPCVSRSSLGLKSILKIPGLEPGMSLLSFLSAYHLRYISDDPSAHTRSISGHGLAGVPCLHLFIYMAALCLSKPSGVEHSYGVAAVSRLNLGPGSFF